ncbi:MAG: phosphodiester glycosidase family protein [Schwartzia sp.]|nr:phosphodiester glycosidase family protein [Schwartzia sp. (in: firmicutes)]
MDSFMRRFSSRAAVLLAVFIFVISQFSVTGAARRAPSDNRAAQTQNADRSNKQSSSATLSAIRFGSNDERDRIVFDLSAIPKYDVNSLNGGKRIVLTMRGLKDKSKTKPTIKSDMVKRAAFQTLDDGLRITIDLAEPLGYEVKTLKNPNRLFINFSKVYEHEYRSDKAEGLTFIDYVRRDKRGRFNAYLLDVDMSKYRLEPILANGVVQGRETVSEMSDDMNAVAAINATYFERNGEIIGLLRMNDTIVGTTYFTRSSLGIKKNGNAIIEPASYTGLVTIGKASHYVAGVNVERGEDSLVIYNSYYGTTTGTNKYGREFTVRNGKVTNIQQADSAIPEDGYVISVHGKARNDFVRVRVGDKVTFVEDIGKKLKNVPDIIGAGPTLVKNGKVDVTAAKEEFPDDIAVGRAPRTGVAILPNNHMMLAVVDGRQAHSIGATLTEFAELLIKYGARDAINFDGGGSSEMVIGGEIVNSPSDGQERPVGSALGVFKR